MRPSTFIEENKKDLIEFLQFVADNTQSTAQMEKARKVLESLKNLEPEQGTTFSGYTTEDYY